MDIASTLLENGANANAESKAGFTPLHLSAQKGHYDMTNLLIEHWADPNHKSKVQLYVYYEVKSIFNTTVNNSMLRLKIRNKISKQCIEEFR